MFFILSSVLAVILVITIEQVERLAVCIKVFRPAVAGYLILQDFKRLYIWINTEEYGLINFNNVKIERRGYLIYSEEE